MYTHLKNIISQGIPLKENGKALIMVHGRGADAESILSLKSYLKLGGFSLIAPQANNNSWYPYSFMAPVTENQPALDSALDLVHETVQSLTSQGIAEENIYFLGFSQGACLTIEYATRNAKKYGGLIIFTGGLIGKEIDRSNYRGNFENTPVLITTGDPDPHVPVGRVQETQRIIEDMGANVKVKVYKGRPHTITQEEINLANNLLNGDGIV